MLQSIFGCSHSPWLLQIGLLFTGMLRLTAFPLQELRAVVQQLQAELQDKVQQLQTVEWEKCRELQAQEQRVQCLSQHLARKEQLLQVRCRKIQIERK